MSSDEIKMHESPEILKTDDSFFPYLAAVLTHLIRLNHSEKEQITLFHSVEPPDSPICEYMHRIRKYFDCSNECFVLSFVYIDRILKLHTDFCVSVLNIHRLLLTSVMLAAKFFDDTYYSNAVYARIGGVPTEEMNSLEYHFLALINYRLFVPVQEYDQYRRDVLVAATAPIPRSLSVSKTMGNSHQSENYSKLTSSPKYYRVNLITTFVPRSAGVNNSKKSQQTHPALDDAKTIPAVTNTPAAAAANVPSATNIPATTVLVGNPTPCEVSVLRQQPYMIRPYYLNNSSSHVSEQNPVPENSIISQMPLTSLVDVSKHRRRSHTQNKSSACRICSVCRQRVSPNNSDQRGAFPLYSQQQASSQYLPNNTEHKISKPLIPHCSTSSSGSSVNVFPKKKNNKTAVSPQKNLTPKVESSPNRASLTQLTPTKPCGYGSCFLSTVQSLHLRNQQQQKPHVKTHSFFEKRQQFKNSQQIASDSSAYLDLGGQPPSQQQRTYISQQHPVKTDHAIPFHNTKRSAQMNCSTTTKHCEQQPNKTDCNKLRSSSLHRSSIPSSYEQCLRPLNQPSSQTISSIVDTSKYFCEIDKNTGFPSEDINNGNLIPRSEVTSTSGCASRHSPQENEFMRYTEAAQYNGLNSSNYPSNAPTHVFGSAVNNSFNTSRNLALPSTSDSSGTTRQIAGNSMYTLLFPSPEKSARLSCSGGAMMTNDSMFSKVRQMYGIPFPAVYY